jgi:hypothetical protein
MYKGSSIGLLAYSFALATAFLLGPFCQAQTKERIFHFPKEYSVGRILLVDQPLSIKRKARGAPIATAQGDVRVPAGKSLKFHPGAGFFQHPECVLKLPPDAFDFIELQFMSMADNEDGYSDKVIPYVHHLSGLKGIDLDDSETTDAGLAQLGTMPELLVLSADSCMISGTTLAKLKGCTKLRVLRIGKAKVDNESLRHLQQFPQLENFGAVHVNLNLKGLSYIARCSNMRSLELGENPLLDDYAVPYLLQMKKLKSISLKQTRISVPGIVRLARAGVDEIGLPRPFHTYNATEQAMLRKAFPAQAFSSKRSQRKEPDNFNETMYGPLSRDRFKSH